MKNKFISIILFTILLLPTGTFAVEDAQIRDENPVVVEETIENLSVDQPREENLGINNEDTQIADSLPYKQPISKRKLIKKFLLAMFAVGLSSVILYLGLTVYNRLRCNIPVQVKTSKGETSLSSPEDLESAAKTFLDKTNWT